MAEPWDAECQEIFREARLEAERLGHTWLGTEHIALGMLKRSSALLLDRLRELGVEPNALREAIGHDLEGVEAPGEGLTLTPRVKRMVDLLSQHTPIHEADLLQALLQGGPGSAVRALEKARLAPRPTALFAPPVQIPLLRNPVLVDLLLAPPPVTAAPLIGREEELEALMVALCRADRVRPLLVGQPGVGKTALVRAVAARLATGEVPEELRGASLIEGTELRPQPRTIFVVEELHRQDVRALLKTQDVRWMATSIDASFIDAELQRHFHVIPIQPADVELTLRILEDARTRYPVAIDDDALQFAAQAHLDGRCMPDLALDLIDEAFTWARKAGRVGRADVERVLLRHPGA
ncbi:MAG: AAA family ATPase [Candidatus Xenobia bacterium]